MSPKELAEKLKKIKQKAKENIKDAVQTSALLVERDAKINAPVDQGTLRNSISHRILEGAEAVTAEVGSSVFYGPFQEYGTGARGESSGVITPSDYEYGSSKGIPAQPYLGPALLKNRAKIRNLISKAVRNALKG